jgi:hypothetical protein
MANFDMVRRTPAPSGHKVIIRTNCIMNRAPQQQQDFIVLVDFQFSLQNPQ